MLLNNQMVKEDIKTENIIYLETNQNENVTQQNSLDEAK